MDSLSYLWQEFQPQAAALAGPGREPLPYRQLSVLQDQVARALYPCGLKTGDCVGLAAPHGPDLAGAFLGLAAHFVVAPLNPALTEADASFTLSDAGARALVVSAALLEGTAVRAAQALGLAILRLDAGPQAGAFTLALASGNAPERHCPAPAGTVLLLHTSGTTARPKLVPLSAANLSHSARQAAASLQLTPADRSLCVMPLFHVHGLVAGLLAPLASGGSVWVPPPFQAHGFRGWLAESQATWYTAVPTMHQMILLRNKQPDPRGSLRQIRSCSAPLPDGVWDQLEQHFGVPVLNAYGMTEAAHQISSTSPLSTRQRGTVGQATGVKLAILNEDHQHVAPGTAGEVAIQGPSLTAGYVGLPVPRPDDWFLTGDQGVLDKGDCVRLLGRFKELINCGGEKISPYEVEAVLLRHPHVLQAASFPVPHPVLGEAIGAAVVLRAEAQTQEAELRSFTAEHLGKWKSPRCIRIVDDLPKGPTGKLQRQILARLLGFA